MEALAAESTAQARQLLGPRAPRSRVIAVAVALLKFRLGTLPMPSTAKH